MNIVNYSILFGSVGTPLVGLYLAEVFGGGGHRAKRMKICGWLMFLVGALNLTGGAIHLFIQSGGFS